MHIYKYFPIRNVCVGFLVAQTELPTATPSASYPQEFHTNPITSCARISCSVSSVTDRFAFHTLANTHTHGDIYIRDLCYLAYLRLHFACARIHQARSRTILRDRSRARARTLFAANGAAYSIYSDTVNFTRARAHNMPSPGS